MSAPPSKNGFLDAPSVIDWRGRLAALGTLLTAAVGLAALAGFAARWGWAFELASHFRVQYFWGLLIGAVALFVVRRWRAACAAGLLVAIHAGLLSPFYALDKVSQPRDPNLRVLAINLYAGNRQYDDVLQFVREESPDVAVFVEVSDLWAEKLTALDDAWPHSRTRARLGSFGIALYSRLPLDDLRIEYLSNGCPAVVARIDVGGTPVTIFGAHPYPPMTSATAEARDRQMAALAELVVAVSGEKIVAGDLNTSSWSPVFANFVDQTRLIDSRSGLGVQPSWRADWPPFLRIPIDHCLVSSGVLVINRRLGPNVGSDHLPVIVDLAVLKNQSP